MIPQHIKERIAKDAESQYLPCGGCGATKPADRCVGCFHSFAQLAADGYISGAEAEAERAEALIECLLKIKNNIYTTHAIDKKIDETLATYNSKK